MVERLRQFLGAALIVSGVLGLTGSPARADIVPDVGTPAIVGIGGGQFRWDYSVSVSATETVNTGDFFTIYDFNQIQSVTPAAGWSFSIQNTGITPGNVIPTDNPAITNVTFTYTAAPPIPGGGTTSTPLGVFSVVGLTNVT